MKAHLIRGAFYLLLLLAVCVAPFALEQRTTAGQNTSTNTNQAATTPIDSGPGAAGRTLTILELPTAGLLWNQFDNPATEPPVGIGSQDFEPALDACDSEIAGRTSQS